MWQLWKEFFLFLRQEKKWWLLPRVTHVDYSARVQTVKAEQNERLYGLLDRFEELTGWPVLVNTFFNFVRWRWRCGFRGRKRWN